MTGVIAFLLSAREARGSYIDVVVPTGANNSYIAQPSYEVIPSRIDDSHIQIVQESYIQAYSSPTLPRFTNLGFTARLIGPTTEVIFLPGDEISLNAGQCVNYVRYVLGSKAVNYSGNAIDWKRYINTNVPSTYSIVVMNVGKWGHLGFVLKYDDKTVTIRSRNWQGKWIISDDVFDRDDSRILGYILP